MPAGVRHADLSVTPGRRAAGRPRDAPRGARLRADVVNEIVRIEAGRDDVGAGQRPGLRRRPAAGARRRHAVLAAVGPPAHAVGRRAARRPRRRRHRARDRRRAGRVRRPAGLGPGPDPVVAERPHRRLVAVPPSAARRGRARARRRQRHRRPAVGVRPEPLRAARRRPDRAGLRPRRRRPARRPLARRRPARARPPLRDVPVRHGPGHGGRLPGRRPVERGGGAAGRRRRRRRPRCCARPATSGWTRPGSRARARHVPDGGPRHRHRRGARARLPAGQPDGHRPRGGRCRR